MIYKQCLKGCALCTSIMEREFKLPAWNGQNVVLLSIIRAVSDFSPLEKHMHLPITFVFLLLQWKQKKRSLGSKDKTRKVRWAGIFVSKIMLLLDFTELVNSLIYSYCWSFLCGFFFFLLRDCFNFTAGGQRTSDENERCFANSHHHPSRDLSIVTEV